MKNTKKTLISNLDEKITSIGINLSILASIIKFLDVSITDNSNYTKADLLNLIAVLSKILNSVIVDYSDIEQLLDL